MVYIEMTGGLGNQLFKYAAARSVQLQTGEPIAIYKYHHDPAIAHTKIVFQEMISPEADICFVDEKPGGKAFYKEVAPVRSFFFSCTYWFYRKLHSVAEESQWHRAEERLQPFWNRIGFCVVSSGYIPFKRYRHPKDFFMCGYFTSRRFLGKNTDVLRTELRHPELIPQTCAELVEQMHNTNSVAVHIRLGDYLQNPEYRKLFYLCNEEYYRKAFAAACEELKNPVFFIFFGENYRAVVFCHSGCR